MRILGWALFAATCAMFILQGLFLAASTQPLVSYDVLVEQVFPLLGLGAVVGAGVGALIISRYPRNLIGWLFLVGQFGTAACMASGAFGHLVSQGVVDAPVAGQISFYVATLFDTTYTVTVLAVIFMIAPDGRLLSRRWRLAVGVAILALALRIGALLTLPAGSNVPGEIIQYSGFSLLLVIASFFTLLLSILLGGVALVLRLRRSTGQQRLQLRWISTAGAVLTGTFLLFAVDQFLGGPAVWFLTEITLLAYIFVSVSVGVAILKYRLYDIDVILSRAIVLGVLAVFVTVGYVGVVVAIGSVLVAVGAPGSALYWPSLVAIALVAVAFQPLRRHVLRLADQLVYGNRAAPYEALATLSRRLADSPSPDALPARVAEATGRAVGAARILVWLGVPGAPSQVRRATWSDGDSTSALPAGSAGVDVPSLVLPVEDMDEQVGSIEVTMPPGRTLRTFERHLLEDVAAQAGVAFRNALLETELADRVAQGEAQSVELAASRRRLVGVEDEARERLAGAIRRSVVPHLAAVDTGLSADAADPEVLAGRLSPLIAEIERALEELRTVCRGVFPALLERRGLIPALYAQLDATHPLTVLDIDDSAERRLNRAAEAAAYLFCVEVAPTDRRSIIGIRVEGDLLVAAVTGDGSWAADTDRSGRSDDVELTAAWQHARDRVAALDGEIRVQRDNRGAVTVTAVIPLGAQAEREPAMATQISSSRSGPNADLGT